MDKQPTPEQMMDFLRGLTLDEIVEMRIRLEREECAKIAEDRLRWVHQDSCYEEIAAAIRART